jgi:hypothetical protein
MRILWYRASLIACLLLATAILTACGGSPASPIVSPASPTVRAIIKPTDRPTNTPIASSTPTVPSATLTPTPDTRFIDLNAPDVDPLTGEKVADPAVLNRRPLAIKIGDSWEIGVRPQAGASYADWVIEHESEGGIPRWTAIFYGQTPKYVGGTRSCRIIDNEIPAIFKSLLACSGMSGGTREFYLKPSDFNQQKRFFTPDFGDYTPMFYRSNSAPIPHNLMVVPAEIWKEADQRGSNAKPDLSGLTFSAEPISPGRPTNEIKLKYGSETETWKYDPETATCGPIKGCWLRWSAGVPHADALNGQQLSAANAIVAYVNHVEDKRYLEEDYGAFKAFGLQIQIWNEGPVRIFRDGQEFGGKWVRKERGDMLTFVDPNGNSIPLKPGKTWLEVVNLGTPLETK